jgi:hypothetical protein
MASDKVFCRELNCGASFATMRHRDQHQDLMHKNMIKNAAYLLLEKIIETNTPESLRKKVVKINSPHANLIYSYREINDIINDSTEEGKVLQKAMMNIVETYFAHNPDLGVSDMLKNSEFKIK